MNIFFIHFHNSIFYQVVICIYIFTEAQSNVMQEAKDAEERKVNFFMFGSPMDTCGTFFSVEGDNK